MNEGVGPAMTAPDLPKLAFYNGVESHCTSVYTDRPAAKEMRDELLARIADLDAALAERDKSLEDLYAFLKTGDVVTVSTPGKRGSITFNMDRLADLHARSRGKKP